VFADILFSAKTHSGEIHPGYLKATGQSSLAVYEGAKLAASVVTKAIAEADQAVLNEVMTPEAAAGMANILECYDPVKRENDLIPMPTEDILLSWIHQISLDKQQDLYKAVLVTISFPAFGFMNKKVRENHQRQDEWMKATKETMQAGNASASMDDLMKANKDLAETMFDPNPFFVYHPLVVSNFHLVRSTADDASWLIDRVSMNAAKDVMNPVGYFKWKGRMAFALKRGQIMPVLRFDYFTDLLIVALLLSGISTIGGGGA